MTARTLAASIALALLLALSSAAARAASGPIVGVSWSNFQEERWKTDEAALRAGLEARGARVLSADAQSSSEKQISDIEGLLARGAEVLIVVAHDSDAIAPAVAMAGAEGIPVIAYDRLIDDRNVFYLSFDNREVGRLQARAVQERQPTGRYVFIKGAAQDPNADFVHAGQLDVLTSAIEAGRIEVVAEHYVDGWLPEVAQRTMEQILTARENEIDAVVCSNDGMAGGVVAALSAQGLVGIPVSGQDGDHAALNRVALGSQSVSVWKDARNLGEAAARVALELTRGTDPAAIVGRTRYFTPRGASIDAILLTPVAITRENLGVVIDAGWVSRTTVCRGVRDDAPVPACGP